MLGSVVGMMPQISALEEPVWCFLLVHLRHCLSDFAAS
jgi:hypothetical protein